MIKPKIIVPILIAVIALIAVYLYYGNTKPISFPSNEVVIKSMNEHFPTASASEILASVQLDKRHVFVPFKSSSDRYGASYWVYEKREWRIARIDTSGQPYIWKLNFRDPSTYRIVWNLDPRDQLNELQYYLIGERYYSVSEGIHFYTPRIQKQMTVSLEERTYGAIPLPEEWENILSENFERFGAKQPTTIFRNSYSSSQMYMGWIPYHRQGESTFPSNSVNGDGYSQGDSDFDYMRLLNETDLELPLGEDN